MINNHYGMSETFRPNNRLISGFKIEQLKVHDILIEMRRNEQCDQMGRLFFNIWPFT